MSGKEFISGDDAVAIGARLARPQVVAAYPITPQTIVVERMADYVENGTLTDCAYVRVESENSALSCVFGASAMGARTFTATSSHGLMYMAEVMPFVSGCRFPVVMMNANRTLAAPWSIFNDHSDSMMLLNAGWLQMHVEDAQEALDAIIQAFRIAEDPRVSSPIMVNLDGFILTHTYELVDIPSQEAVDAYLPSYQTENKMSLENPLSVSIGIPPHLQTEFRYRQHKDILRQAPEVIRREDEAFRRAFGRGYGGLAEHYRCDDAEAVLVTLGSVTMTARSVVDKLRAEGLPVGLVKLRYLRPFPVEELLALGGQVKAVGVVDKSVSPGFEGTVFTQVNSVLSAKSSPPATLNFIGGLAGREITTRDLEQAFRDLLALEGRQPEQRETFINMRWEDHVQ